MGFAEGSVVGVRDGERDGAKVGDVDGFDVVGPLLGFDVG